MILGEIYISPLSSLTFDKIHHPFEKCTKYIQKFTLRDSYMYLRFTSNIDMGFRLVIYPSSFQQMPGNPYDIPYIMNAQKDNEPIDDLWSYRILLNLVWNGSGNPPQYTIDKLGLYRVELQVKYGEDWYAFLCTCIEFISEEEAAEKTVLMEAKNRVDDWFVKFTQGDVVKWRINGGMLKQNFESRILQNSFRDQRTRQHQLSQRPYTTKLLTIGGTDGVPVWAGEKLNHFLSLTDISMTYKEETKARIVRSDGDIPASTQIADYYPLYVFKCRVEEQIDPVRISETIPVSPQSFSITPSYFYVLPNDTGWQEATIRITGFDLPINIMAPYDFIPELPDWMISGFGNFSDSWLRFRTDVNEGDTLAYEGHAQMRDDTRFKQQFRVLKESTVGRIELVNRQSVGNAVELYYRVISSRDLAVMPFAIIGGQTIIYSNIDDLNFKVTIPGDTPMPFLTIAEVQLRGTFIHYTLKQFAFN